MVLSFHYRPGQSILHRSSPSIKIIIYFIFNLFLSISSPVSVISILCILLFLGIKINQNLLKIAQELRSLLWIFLITYLSKAHLNGGKTFIIFPESVHIPITWNANGAISTLFFILQILTAIISTDLLMLSTKANDLQSGIYNFLAIFHNNFAWRVSMMFRIMLSSLPILMDNATLAHNRLRARGLVPRKQSLRYLRGMSFALFWTLHHLSSGYSRSIIMRGGLAQTPEKIFITPIDIQLILYTTTLCMLSFFLYLLIGNM